MHKAHTEKKESGKLQHAHRAILILTPTIFSKNGILEPIPENGCIF